VSDVLRVGQAILDWLRDQTTHPAEPEYAPPEGAARLYGIPVRFDPDLPTGSWRLMRDGEVAGEGFVGQEGMITAYLTGRGFISFAAPELPEPRLVMLPIGQASLYGRVAFVDVADPNPTLRITGV
jgi:hypothetical protein